MEQNNWIGDRVQALTTMHLTRRVDITVQPRTENDWEPDYLAFVNSRNRQEERRFGLFLYDTKKALTLSDADRALKSKLSRGLRGKEFSYPVCLLDFSMATDEGFFTWFAEPKIKDGLARLHYHLDAHSCKLDRESLDQIVDAVNAWYDAFYATIHV